MGLRALRVICLLSTALTVAGCFDRLYDERDVVEGELVVCCDTAIQALARHRARKGENFTMRIFPACECTDGPGCHPLYTAAPWGCTLQTSGGFIDAGVPFSPDAGTFFDAGSSADAGSRLDAGMRPDAGSPGDAGQPAPTYWSACCIDSNLVSCRCPEFGPCAADQFKLCDSMSCTLGDTCPAH